MRGLLATRGDPALPKVLLRSAGCGGRYDPALRSEGPAAVEIVTQGDSMSRDRAFPLHAELPWFGYASEGAVLTKRGELLAGARLQGAPFECRAPDALDNVALRWTLALKSLVPGWRIRWHARKRRLAALPQRPAGDALSARAQSARNAALIGRGLYSIDASVYWLWDPRLSPPGSTQRASWLGEIAGRINWAVALA